MHSQVKMSRTGDQIEGDLHRQSLQMTIHMKNSNYVGAQTCRVKIQQLKKDLEDCRLHEMISRHRRETAQMVNSHEEELMAFNAMWNKQIEDISSEGDKHEKELADKHNNQLEKLRHDLEEQLPLKVKESSECLNLKKMQEHMCKQKNFVEAHRVQQSITEMERREREAWLQNRDTKIENALNTLRTKQASEAANLKKRIKTSIDQTNRQRIIEEQRLKQKSVNAAFDLKSQHDKEVLAYQGLFRSKVQVSSPMKSSKGFSTR